MAPTSQNVAPNTSAAAANSVSPENLKLLSERGRKSMENLMAQDTDGAQRHVYADWPPAGIEDDRKRSLADQLADLDASYPGGLSNYITKAKALLQESSQSLNPFSDYEATVPAGESLSFDGQGTMSFSEAEQMGIEACAGAVFVLVAGGLGERLGYSGIKLSLETNLCTNKCYLEIYIKYIQAMQYLARIKTGRDDISIPLVIMTSGDTDPLTRQLLTDNNNFGMDEGLVHIVTQDKVAALKDGSAGLALDDDDRWTVQTKPHGHGDGKCVCPYCTV
jgi:UDP-sugar pyrophosphorylase